MGKNPSQKAKEIEAKKTKAKAAETDAAPKKVVKAKKKATAEASPEKKGSAKSCKMKACKREYRAKGYCNVHYKKWRRGEYGIARYKVCEDFECRKPMARNRHGYCEDHFQNYYVKGIEVARVPAPAAQPKKEEKAAAAG